MPLIDYVDPDRFVAGTVGPAGQRTFFLQAVDGRRVTSVSLEKAQVAMLAERLEELLDQLGADDRGVTITFDQQAVPVPEPFAAVLMAHRDNRTNMNTATNAGSAWLFPGVRAGQHLHPSYLRSKLRDSGIHLLGARNTTLRSLVLAMPPAIAAEALGYGPIVAEKHAADSGATWVTYASYSRDNAAANMQPRAAR